jgi:hypothetical protein
MDNPQYLVFNENRALLDRPRTIICTGQGRSGTSAVMSLIEFLGVWVGVQPSSRNRENRELKKAFREGPETAKKLIEDYNERFPVWGFKAPSLRKDLNETIGLFRNPIVIVPHRDAVGRLGRQMVSGDQPVSFDILRRTVVGQRRLLDELQDVTAPQLHISFSLLSGSPEDAIKAISEFAGIPVPEGNVRAHANKFRRRYLRPVGQAAAADGAAETASKVKKSPAQSES